MIDRAAREHEVVEIPYEWLARDHRLIKLVLRFSSTRDPVPVVRPEAFWLLKLQAGRLQDLTDLFTMVGRDLDMIERSLPRALAQS